MKLWQKNTEPEKIIESFTIGNDAQIDLLLAPFDVLGSMAHARMLSDVGLLTNTECRQLLAELRRIYSTIEAGDFEIEAGVEDVHSQIELMLTRKLGETGKKIHAGRSRNDQVLLDLRLYTRSRIVSIVSSAESLFVQLIALSNRYASIGLPGYTHLQIAMPSSFGLWFGAYAESLVDDLLQLQAAWRIINKNPLGSAAGYGTSLPLNRELTTRLLGFGELNVNSVYAQMGRGKSERVVASAIASIAETLARLAMDICLYMNQNFGFIRFPDELTTGSSIMPHKKNPDVFELVRGKCNLLKMLPAQIGLLTANLPSGYHRELQLAKAPYFEGLQTITDCLDITTYMLGRIIVNEQSMVDPRYDYLHSVDAVNERVLAGMSFRDAYVEIGEQIEDGNFVSGPRQHHTHIGSKDNLGNDLIEESMTKILAAFDFEAVDAATAELLAFAG